ncbi:helix-turn-helix domain-containing protein [Burkholderia cepacia]|uniref:helix-turn-helix domain-containing protein n=1 Tax=Burkholderia cepacia TaxID=292 RepID=UPI001CF29A1D|nr:helix-turn-helix transcriptional regulator [Burkholderia cepacia]MCA8075357.1 helix-turn-helix domain-containing protein [Burkholderia cepacia]
MLDTKKILAANLTELLERRPDISRLNLSKQIHVADGTLGRIKYGTGNPTVEILDQIARFFKVEAWQLLAPDLGRSKEVAGSLISGDVTPTGTKLSGGAARNHRLNTGLGLSEAISQAVGNAVEEALAKWELEQRKAG